jgi:hypothetical protein
MRERLRDDGAENRDRFVGCEDLERAEVLLLDLVKFLARQLALEDHLAEKKKGEKEKG